MSSPAKGIPEYPSTYNTTSNEVTVVILDLEVNSSSGFIFDGSPPHVTRLVHDIPSLAAGQSIVGYYFQSLQIPGVEITNVYDTSRLHQLLLTNKHLPRRLMLCSHAPQVQVRNDECRYIHDIPATAYLGVHFSGFPAKVASLDPKSPMAGKIHPGQSVYAVIVPGQPDLEFNSGGFTGHRVQEHLRQNSHVPQKQLVLVDRPMFLKGKASNAAFDKSDCIVQ